MSKSNRIYDAVYGYIELNELEFNLVNSPIFQRLHWIKQLGPLHIIFPSAQHSRFSHSIGVFYIMKKMLEHLKRSKYHKTLSEKDEQNLRLAALLHDIGHVPLSHVGESVLKSSFVPEEEKDELISGTKPRTWKSLFADKYVADTAKLHELLSVEIVLKSKDIEDILKTELGTGECKRVRQEIAEIIVGEHQDPVFNSLLHSELDADRLDYLLRDSFFTGVGYGHVDLDYIISRICPIEDGDGIIQMCFEEKGLHTIEHYILGRFFIHTQVIFNRKVKFLDLIFADVLKYMIKHKNVMNLSEVLDCIRCEVRANIREAWHRLYRYTDAEVFTKMRSLHEELDLKEKEGTASEEERYINDCIKIIMDGDVRNPIGGTSQIVVPISSLDDREYVKQLKKQSGLIAQTIAAENDICRNRIIPNISEQIVMKYTRIEDEEESLKEAVRVITSRNGTEKEVIYAAESKATILSGLIDKKLLVFNLYYVQSKGEIDTEIKRKEDIIEQGFRDFINVNFLKRKMPCGCDSGKHLCQQVLDRTQIDQIKSQVKQSRFICSKCGRISLLGDNLCRPLGIES